MFLFSADGTEAFGSADLPAVSEASAALEVVEAFPEEVSPVVAEAFPEAEGHMAAAEPAMDFNIYNGAVFQ